MVLEVQQVTLPMVNKPFPQSLVNQDLHGLVVCGYLILLPLPVQVLLIVELLLV